MPYIEVTKSRPINTYGDTEDTRSTIGLKDLTVTVEGEIEFRGYWEGAQVTLKISALVMREMMRAYGIAINNRDVTVDLER